MGHVVLDNSSIISLSLRLLPQSGIKVMLTFNCFNAQFEEYVERIAS